MSIDDLISDKIREVVREELSALSGRAKRFTPEELAKRWHTDRDFIVRLARGGRLRGIRISERKIIFSIEEVLRFEEAGGIDLDHPA